MKTITKSKMKLDEQSIHSVKSKSPNFIKETVESDCSDESEGN